MRQLSVFLLILLCGCSQESFNSPSVMPVVVRETGKGSSGILRIEIRDGNLCSSGTAFVIRQGGKDYVITATHTLNNKGIIYLMYEDRTPMPFEIRRIIRNEGVDAAAIEAVGIPEHVRRLDVGNAIIGNSVEAEGFPEAKERVSVRGGVISRMLEASCKIRNGMSGGPLISGGKVVGVLSSRVLRNDDELSSHVDMQDVLGMIEGAK